MNLSVLVATYGGDEWQVLADRAVRSARAQAEVVAVHQPDGDIATARNAAAADATGDWLCFLDADDELHPNFVAAMRATHTATLRHNRRDATKLLFNPAVSYVRRGRPARPIQWRRIPLESGNWLIVATVVHRDVFEQAGGFRPWPHGLEDWDLWCRAEQQGCHVVPVRDAIYVAHRNDESKHHVLARDAKQYMYWHQKVGSTNFPDLYDAPTPEEDEALMLLEDGQPRATLRLLSERPHGGRIRYVADGVRR